MEIGLLVPAVAAAATLPGSLGVTGQRWQPRWPSLPAPIRAAFLAPALVSLLAWAVAYVVLALVPSYAAAALGGRNLLVDGAAAGSLLLVAALAQAACRSWDPARAQETGLIGLAGGLLGLIAAGLAGSVAVLFAAMAVAGAGQGLAFMGGIRRINEIAPPGARAGTVSMFYVVTYAGSGLVTVGVGLLATLLGLAASVRWFGAVLAAACLLMLLALRVVPALSPAAAIPAAAGPAAAPGAAGGQARARTRARAPRACALIRSAVQADQGPAALEDPAVGQHGVHVAGLGRGDQQPGRVGEHAQVRVAGVNEDDVGALAGRERPGHRVQAQRPGPVDGAERQRLPGGAGEFLLGRAVHQPLGQFHDREHVGVAGQRGGVHGQADADPGRQELGRFRQPVADQQLAERRQAHRAPGLGELADLLRGRAVRVHDLQVRPEQAARRPARRSARPPPAGRTRAR